MTFKKKFSAFLAAPAWRYTLLLALPASFVLHKCFNSSILDDIFAVIFCLSLFTLATLLKIVKPAFILLLVAITAYAGYRILEFTSRDTCDATKFRHENFNIKLLDYAELPYVLHSVGLYNVPEVMDADSIPLFDYHEKWSYHPVQMTQYALILLDVYKATGAGKHLLQAERIAAKLCGIAVKKESALLFPYAFDYVDYKDRFEKLEMEAPWFSGMAQGQVLSLFCRLHELTGKSSYLESARSTFNSFALMKGNKHKIWITCADKSGNYWIEEYPHEKPCHVLNGMVFAMYGLYDYYRLTKDDECKLLLQASLTTIKRNAAAFRNKHEASSYCLNHFSPEKHGDYHIIHITQLRMLYKITGDKSFDRMANRFDQDTKSH